MTNISQYQRPGRLALAGAVFLALAATGVTAGEHAHGADETFACDCPEGLEIVSAPWVRMMPPGMGSTAAYLTLANHTDEDIELVRGESPVAGVTELHDHVQDDAGVMRMREVEAITIPAGGKTALEPGGLHVMLIDLHEPLERDQRVSVTLETAEGETARFDATVRDGGGARHGHGSGHHGH